MSKVDPIDPNVPGGDEDPKLGDDRIRELAKAVAELLGVNHYMGADGGAGVGYNEDSAGEHTQIKFNAPLAADPTKEANKLFLYPKDISGKVQFIIMDEDGNVIQLTSAGGLNPALACLLTGNQAIAGTKTFADIKASQNLDIGSYELRAQTLQADVATGTAPFTVASATKVLNLNADKVDGKDIDATFGSWASKSVDTVYQAASDGFVLVTSTSTDQRPYYTVFTDSSNPPTTNRFRARDTDANTVIGACVPVKKNDYWKVADSGTFGNITIYWLPVGA